MRPELSPAGDTFTRDGLTSLLKEVARVGGTEVHFKVPSPPLVRIEGSLRPLGARKVTSADTEKLAELLAALGGRPPEHSFETELAFGITGVGRFQAHLYQQRGSIAALVRRVDPTPPTLADLGAPAAFRAGIGIPGLTVLAGPRAVTWLHAAVDDYNRRAAGLVLLAERPLAWLHKDEESAIAHREVGVDVPDFATAVLSGQIVGADLLAIGDVPDGAAAEAILLAAERGHALLVALVAPDATIAREQFLRVLHGEARADAAIRFDRALTEIWECPG